MVVQFLFIVLELIGGFISLWIGGVGYLKALEHTKVSEGFLVEEVTVDTSFLVIFLIADALVWLFENIFHYALLVPGAAKYILEHPPAFNTSPFEFIPQSSGKKVARILFIIRLVLFIVVRLFQLVWTLIAFCKLATEILSPTTFYITTQGASRSYPQKKDLQQFNSTATLVRGLTACFVTLNLVSLTLWTFLAVFCVVMRIRSNSCAAHIEDSHQNNNAGEEEQLLE